MKVTWKSCLKVGVSIFLLYLCIYYWPSVSNLFVVLLSAAAPLLIGCAIAYVVNILMSFYERHYFPKSEKKGVRKSCRPVCMLAAFITVIAIIVLVIILIVPQLVSCVQLLVAKVTDSIPAVVAYLDELDIFSEDLIASLNSIDWNARIQQLISVLGSGIGSAVNVVISAVSSVISGVVTAFLAIIFSIYLLLGRNKLSNQCSRLMNRYMRKSWYDKTMHVLSVLNDSFHRYIVGQCTEAVILGALCTLGMWILRLPYAAMIGALIAFTALIPVAGAYIGGGIGAFMILTESPIKAVIFLVFLIILQQVEGNLIYPRVVGSSLGLPALWVLAAVTIGGGLMGIAGMLLGVPIASAVYRLIREGVNKPAAVSAEKAAPPEETGSQRSE